MEVQKLEESWTPTTIQAAFILHSPSSDPRSGDVSINLPLLHLGWTFTLSSIGDRKKKPLKSSKSPSWIPQSFSFRRHGSTLPWGNTCMHAQLSLAVEQHDRSSAAEQCTSHNDVGSNSTPLGTMKVVLADTPSVEVRLTTSHTLPLLQPTKVLLAVTISKCPFPNGLFQAVSGQSNETEAQAWLVKQSCGRLLSRSLTTGKLFDVKFLTCSTRSTSAGTGKLFQTYASLSVLEEHVNLSSAKLREEWTSALAALNHSDNADAKHVGEILCPNDYDYELDSDFEDEDEASPPLELCGSSPSHECNLAILEGQQSESNTERSSSSFSSFELEGASDQDLFDNQPEEVIKSPGEPPHLYPVAASDHKRTVLIRFAAHRTWYAFLWYCYTGHLEFSKLKSQVEPGTGHLRLTHVEDGPPSCSPKSMYRLADLIDDKVLKVKALEAIRERMTEVNILDEMFSVFTSKYPDVREVQLDVLMKHWRSPEVKKAFLRTMSKFGNMPHAEPALSAFYDGLAAQKSQFGNVPRAEPALSAFGGFATQKPQTFSLF